ncbi:hypothetical protein [Methylococcus sp. EFPC2]|uniref:hypothetical protein n=1 Tax=Methylococcus sp. EFPC2 TaxID=2812648 RepID=UPI0019683455|nr:hypothetical protein [Methylococcus sp. EFPC2]QSA98668.1 hypothetical protein JWZ97_07720 [Methylococcus sp. EFPC2]
MKSNSRIRRLTLGLIALAGLWLSAAPALAFEWINGKVQLHGYLTQGAVYTTANNFYGDSHNQFSPDFREVGLNLSLQPFSRLRLAAQGMSRWAGKMDEGEPWLDFALADINLYNDENLRFGVRAGRVKNPFGFYTETRDVAFTRPGAILPQPIYFDRTRRFALSGDGVHLYSEVEVPGGHLDIRFALTDLPTNDDSTKAALTGVRGRGDLLQDRMTPGFRVLYETEDGRWRGGVSYFSLKQTYTPAADERIPRQTLSLDPWILSLQYAGEKLTLTTEYSQRYTQLDISGRPSIRATAENWYVMGQYRFLPKWELMLRYDQAHSDMDDPYGHRYHELTGAPAHTRYAQDVVAGLRFDVTSSLMLRAEYHHVDGTVWLSPLDNPDRRDLERRWDMVILLGSYRF